MTEVVTDKLGRKIILKKPNTMERIKFFRILGPQDCSNQMVLSEFSNAMWVQSIDDKPMPKNQLGEIEHIIAELEKGDASEAIDKYRIDLYLSSQKNENNGDIEVVKK